MSNNKPQRHCRISNYNYKTSKRYVIPKTEELGTKWSNGISNNTLSTTDNNDRVCSNHFEKECIQVNKKLKKGSLPTLFITDFKQESEEECVFLQKDVSTLYQEPKVLKKIKVEADRFSETELQEYKNSHVKIPRSEYHPTKQQKAEVVHNNNDSQQELRQEMCIICAYSKARVNIDHLVKHIQQLADVNITEFKLPLKACRICADELDIALKIRFKIIRRSQQVKKNLIGKKLAFTQTDNTNMITRGSQTDKFVQVDIPSGPKLNNLKANTELKKNLIIAPVDLQRYSARKCETSVMEGSIDQNYVSEKDKENGNDDQISMLNVVEKKDFINLPHSEVKSVLRKMAITNKQCLRCYKCFSDNLTLIKHIRKNCSLKLSRGEVVDNVEGTSEQERTCSKCRSIFRTILDLNLHKEFDHNNLVCPQCLTFCYNNIDQHHTLHKSEKKMTCEYCDGTLTKTSVVIHKVAHAWNWWKHGKSPCMNCNELVSNDYRYNHHFECSQKKFVCETCGYVLKTLSSLKKHKLEHEKLYKCVICLKDFFNKKELIRHNQVSHIILSSIQLKKIKLKNDALSPPCQTVKGQKQRNSPKRINFTRTEV